MTRRLIIRDSAEEEITEAVLWYQNQSTGLGAEFLAEVNSTIQSVVENPQAFRRLRRRPEVRRALTVRFPYRIFFILRPDAIVIFCVLHGARHEREWKRNV